MVNGGVDQLVIEEADQVGAELGVPFLSGRGRVGLLLRGDGACVERAC